jgi:alanine-glyoxylate transaminase/serine-glyoxylate transaminase/serine-pyruvate transaminase
MNYWNQNDGGGRSYHHTAPVNAMYALHESLLMLDEEGVENSWQRHKDNHELLKAGLGELGIEYVVEEPYRLAQLNAVTIPAGVDDKEVRMKLLNDYNLEIGGGLGDLAGKVWRIGLMGAACTRQNVEYCLKSLKAVL